MKKNRGRKKSAKKISVFLRYRQIEPKFWDSSAPNFKYVMCTETNSYFFCSRYGPPPKRRFFKAKRIAFVRLKKYVYILDVDIFISSAHQRYYSHTYYKNEFSEIPENCVYCSTGASCSSNFCWVGVRKNRGSKVKITLTGHTPSEKTFIYGIATDRAGEANAVKVSSRDSEVRFRAPNYLRSRQ